MRKAAAIILIAHAQLVLGIATKLKTCSFYILRVSLKNLVLVYLYLLRMRIKSFSVDFWPFSFWLLF